MLPSELFEIVICHFPEFENVKYYFLKFCFINVYFFSIFFSSLFHLQLCFNLCHSHFFSSQIVQNSIYFLGLLSFIMSLHVLRLCIYSKLNHHAVQIFTNSIYLVSTSFSSSICECTVSYLLDIHNYVFYWLLEP